MKKENRLRDERLQIMLSPEELELVDDFRFRKRMPSRASAVRELMRRGLSAEGFTVAEPGRKSVEFGVTDGAQETDECRPGNRLVSSPLRLPRTSACRHGLTDCRDHRTPASESRRGDQPLRGGAARITTFPGFSD